MFFTWLSLKRKIFTVKNILNKCLENFYICNFQELCKINFNDLFWQDARSVSLFSPKRDNCSIFFDKLQKVFHFFRQNTKSVSIFPPKREKCVIFSFSTKCKKCFTFFVKTQEVFQFVQQNVKKTFFSRKCENCFTLFDITRQVFQFFQKSVKSVPIVLNRMWKVFHFFSTYAKSVSL